MNLFIILLVVSLNVNYCHSENWVVIVSGGKGFYNYALQASSLIALACGFFKSNAYHAYKVLRSHGTAEDRIITMMVDDLVDNIDNPFPGVIFNEPNGEDVYSGVKFDYRAEAVTPANFHAILRGDHARTKGGSGRVLESTESDNVFVYFVDHGDSGVICFPDDIITAKQLNDTLGVMNAKRMFKKLVIYVDCCYSGSIFDGILPANMNVYAMTAASATELAFFTFCNLPVIEVCLATVFSHSWIDNSEAMDANVETLADQFDAVSKDVTSANVSDYGDLSIKNELVAEFQGKQKIRMADSKEKIGQYARYTKDALSLRYLESKLRRATSLETRDKLAKSLQQLKAKRSYHDLHTRSLIANITNNHKVINPILTSIPLKIKNFDCHDKVVIAYHRLCFNLGKNPYAQNAVRALTNLCERGYSTSQILAAIHVHCAVGSKFDDIH